MWNIYSKYLIQAIYELFIRESLLPEKESHSHQLMQIKE